MGKVISFELKKLVSRIGVYILVVLLAGLLVAGVFMYNPTERNTSPLTLSGDTVEDMYNNFNNDLKQGFLDNVNSVSTNALTYIPTSSSYMQYNNKETIQELYRKFDDYCLLYSEVAVNSVDYETILADIKLTLLDLKNALDEGLNPTKNSNGYYILTTNSNYTKLYSVLNQTIANFSVVTSHTFASEKYFDDYRKPLNTYINNLVYPNLEQTALKYIENGTYYTLIISRMEEIAHKMSNEYSKAVVNPNLNNDKSIKNELNTLFNRYANCVEIFVNSYNSSMCVSALNTITNKSQRADLLGYSDISLYKQEEIALLNQYYIENHTSPNIYANSLSVSHTSNGKINSYDFTFFIMSIFAIAVIIFSIFLASHTISGEANNTTLRMTALRPVKRSTLFFGKYFAILIMSLILLLFGTITSLIVGGILYGMESAKILIIFNGNLVFSAHPMIVITIFVLSLFAICALYTALTIMLSSILKSDLLAMAIGVVLYAVNLILPLFFGMGSWLRFYPFTNINLFAYFGTNRLSSDSVMAKLFNSVVYQGMNIWISLIYIIGISTLLLLIGRHIFKKREL